MNRIRQAEPATPAEKRKAASAQAEEEERQRLAQAANPQQEAQILWFDRDHKQVRAGFPDFSTKLFGADHSAHFLDHPHVREVRVTGDAKALHVRLADSSTIMCRRSELVLETAQTEANISFLVASAMQLGWKEVQLDGTPEFRAAMAAALIRAGIKPLQPAPVAAATVRQTPPPRRASAPGMG